MRYVVVFLLARSSLNPFWWLVSATFLQNEKSFRIPTVRQALISPNEMRCAGHPNVKLFLPEAVLLCRIRIPSH